MNKFLIVLLIVAFAGCCEYKNFILSFHKLILVPLCQTANSIRRPCPKNMIFDFCGTACPPTCSERKSKICIQVCIMGCFCKDGYVLDNDICIPVNQCSHTQ